MAKRSLKQRKPCTHLAGEFFVSAELSRMGYNVALTMGNAKKVDLVVELESKTVPIQVKALAKKQNVGWPVNPNHKYNKKLIFVLVVLGSVGSLPSYYIVSGDIVQKRMKKYKTRAILNISDVSEFKDNWRLVGSSLK
jgi:hypothetical protein